ncbi:MAG: type I restriction endonuclease subunit R [Bacillota bacterium]|nr:type I restriction endonuclease subunit R [Bacillota bacterium]
MSKLTESAVELYAIEELESQGYKYLHGPAISPDGQIPERQDYSRVILTDRLKKAVEKINPEIPPEAQEQAVREIERIRTPDLISNNEQFHRYLTDGIPVSYRQDGEEKHDYLFLIDFFDPANNEFLVVNQFTVIENNINKRPDIIIFINGLPLIVFEVKNPGDEQATIRKAFDQIQTYKATIPSLFTCNAFCIITDGHECRAGTISADFSRYMAWKSIDGRREASLFKPQLETMIKGLLNKETLLDIIRNFIVYEKMKKEDPMTGISQVETVKKMSAYHQYYAVNKAVESAHQASSADGSRKGGVVWHTQGSGKSLTMVFFTGKIVQSMDNPTIVVITDRNDLDDQLFDTFAASKQLLRQEPVQAADREHLKTLLKVASGGVVFTTIQKFLPDEIVGDDGEKTGRRREEFDRLSDRSNVIVIADEAHRTQYGFVAKILEEKDPSSREVIGQRIAYGFAKYMRDALPNATYIGFTGTPIEKEDKNTPAVFGNYIDIYDIADAVNDGATVRIYYESRLAKVNLDEEGKQLIEEFDRDLEQADVAESTKAKAKWARLEAIIGHPERLKNLAKDIVSHFEARQEVFEGKAMVVTMSRRIAAAIYKELVAIRPKWHDPDLAKGVIKVVMTSASSDGPELQEHHTTKEQRRQLSDRMKDPADPLKIVIVCDMWLTGFDVPCLHTMYIDKPLRGHNLMQAIARVNRIFKDKPGGLVVDYLGIASDLKKALSFYSDSGGKGDPTETQQQAVAMMLEKLEVVRQLFAEKSSAAPGIAAEEPMAYNSKGFNYSRYFTASPHDKLSIILLAQEHILGVDGGKERFITESTYLSKAFALAIPHEEAIAVKQEVAFYQALKARLVKFESTPGEGMDRDDYDTAIKRIVDQALSSDEVVDIFDAAGLQKPDISILSEEFLMEVKGLTHKNLALELLKKLLNDEIRIRSKQNLVKSKAFLEMLETAIKKYQNGLLTTAQIIQELIEIAREIRKADQRNEELGLTRDELAFYDALGTNDSAVKILGDETLRKIAHEVAEKVRANATIDWTIRESARARLKVIVKRTLNKHGYPPDKQPEAIDTVLKQAELLADEWVK